MTDANLTLSQPQMSQKSRNKTKRRVTALVLSAALIGTPIFVAGNAQALGVAGWLQYIQQAQRLLTLIKSGGLGSLSLGNLGNFLTLFKSIPIAELQNQINSIQSTIGLDPQTLKLIGSFNSTLGSLGIPIPSQVNQIASSLSQFASKTDPFGLTYDQNLLNGLKLSSDSLAASVLGDSGQQSVSNLLNDSQSSWQTASDMAQINGSGIVADSVSTAVDAQLSFSSQDVLKAIAIQNAQNSALNQQMGAANIEQGKITAMGVNLAAKNLVIGAQSLQVQQFQAEKLTAAEGGRLADTQGAFNSTIVNAMMFACLSSSDCKAN